MGLRSFVGSIRKYSVRMLTDCNTFWVKILLSLRINLEYEITVCNADFNQMRSLYTSVIRYNYTKTRIREF